MQQSTRAFSILAAGAAFLPACYVVAPPPPAAPVVPAEAPAAPPAPVGTPLEAAPPVVGRPLEVRILEQVSPPAAHPTARVAVPPGHALIGGGCRSNWREGQPGNLLTGSYPAGQEWVCDAKDHEWSSPATLTAFAVAVPADQVDVRVTTQTGNPAQHPTARAVVEDGYTLVGGGCSDHYAEPGNMIWASYPDPAGNAWVCAGKDHHLPSPARISAFAIGVRRRHAR